MTLDRAEKAVILARGLGTRMRRADGGAALDARQAAVAETGVKALIPIGRPFLDYVLSTLADAGFRRACLVVGPQHDALRQRYLGAIAMQRISVEFAVQAEARGTADAVAAAESFAGADPFVVLNSDNFYPVEALHALHGASGSAVALFEDAAMLRGNVPEERLRSFAVAQIDERGCLARILEKPDAAALAALPRPLWVSMNCWRFGPAIFRACRAIGPSPRGEYEITDAVQYTISVLGEPLAALLIRAPVLDLTSRADVASMTAHLAGVEVRL